MKKLIFGILGLLALTSIVVTVGIYIYNKKTGSDVTFPGKSTIDKTLGIEKDKKDNEKESENKTETTTDKTKEVTPVPGGEKIHTSDVTETETINKTTTTTSS